MVMICSGQFIALLTNRIVFIGPFLSYHRVPPASLLEDEHNEFRN